MVVYPLLTHGLMYTQLTVDFQRNERVSRTIIAFKILKEFSFNFSEGNLATKQVVFLQRPVMWNSAVQTPEVSNMFMVLI